MLTTSRSLRPKFFTALATLAAGKPMADISLTNFISSADIVERRSLTDGLCSGIGGDIGGRGVGKRFKLVSS